MSEIERAVDLLHELSANFPEAIAKAIPRHRLDEVAAGLALLVPTEGDEYLESPREVRKLQKQIEFLKEDKAVLADEVSVLKQVDATRQEILTGRIDQLMQEMHVLKAERSQLYEQVAGYHEAMEIRDKLLNENAEIRNTYQTVMIENDRLRKTNAALTQQLFHQDQPVDGDRVLDVLTGRKELDQEKLLMLLANLHQEMIDERARFENQIEVLHTRLQSSETTDDSRSRPPGRIGSAVNNIASRMSELLQSPKTK